MNIGLKAVLCMGIFIFHAVPALGGQPAAIMDSLSGTAHVRRAGTIGWNPAGPETEFHNNDIVRVDTGGFARLRWPDGTTAFVRGGTQILVNITPLDGKTKLFSYATVFAGTVFFVIKKALPFHTGGDIQVYTPTAVISLRGTSFSAGVGPKEGATSVKVVCGTVRVRCIESGASAFMGAPGKTVIGKRTDPIVTRPLITPDLDSLRSWVPGAVIDSEVALHLARGKRDRMIISGKMEEKSVVLPFSVASKTRCDWDAGTLLSGMLASRLKRMYSRLDVVASGLPSGYDPGGAAEKENARFVIHGEIFLLDIINHAEITVSADEYRERSIARIAIRLRLYDAKGHAELLDSEVRAEHSAKKSVENGWDFICKLSPDLENGPFALSLVGVATNQLLDAAVESLVSAMF